MKNENIKKSSNVRSSNIELLRIVSIFIIVFSHFCVHSNFTFSVDALSFNQILVQIGGIGEIGVSIFVIITGYFSINRNNSIKKVISIWQEVWFYNVLLVLLLLVSGRSISSQVLLKHMIPIYNTHWFAYTYIYLRVLIPFINKFICKLDEISYQKILAILFISWGIIYTFTGADLQYSYLGWFVFLYLLGAYIKTYGSEVPDRVANVLLLVTCLSLMIISTIIIDVIGLKSGFYPYHGTHFYSLHSPLVLGSAIAIFQLFRGIKIKNNTFINTIAGTTFAIYLLSDSELVRLWLWNNLFKNSLYSESPFLIFIGVAEAMSVCCVCSAIDIGRKKIFELKPLLKFTQVIGITIEKIYLLIKLWGQKMFNKLL